MRCGHCGRENTLGERVTSTIRRVPQQDDAFNEISIDHGVAIRECESCRELTFETYVWVDEYMDPADVNYTLVYPTWRSPDELPERVAKHFRKMLELQFEPAAFAVFAGRTIEAVCDAQGVTRDEGDLYVRLDLLVAGGEMPKPLVDQAHLVRKYRNLGGHDELVDVEAADVPLIRHFVESLLEFLYWGPASLQRATTDLQNRRDSMKDA